MCTQINCHNAFAGWGPGSTWSTAMSRNNQSDGRSIRNNGPIGLNNANHSAVWCPSSAWMVQPLFAFPCPPSPPHPGQFHDLWWCVHWWLVRLFDPVCLTMTKGWVACVRSATAAVVVNLPIDQANALQWPRQQYWNFNQPLIRRELKFCPGLLGCSLININSMWIYSMNVAKKCLNWRLKWNN